MSRLSRGFHRLGVLLSAPIVLGGMVVVVYALAFSSNGPPIADPRSKTTSFVAVWGEPMPAGAKDPRNPFDQFEPVSGVPFLLDDRRIKLHHVVGRTPLRNVRFEQMSDSELRQISTATKDILAAERQRGRLFGVADSPVLVGDMLVYFDKSQSPFAGKGHLKRTTNWNDAWVGLFIMAAGFIPYVLLQAIGWVVRGFMKDPA